MILANQPGDKSWPMTAATWILIYKKPQDVQAAGEALKFFAWAYAKGGKMAEDLDYVPMPDKVVARRPEDLGRRDQGRQRQAAVRAESDTEEALPTGARPLSQRSSAFASCAAGRAGR